MIKTTGPLILYMCNPCIKMPHSTAHKNVIDIESSCSSEEQKTFWPQRPSLVTEQSVTDKDVRTFGSNILHTFVHCWYVKAQCWSSSFVYYSMSLYHITAQMIVGNSCTYLYKNVRKWLHLWLKHNTNLHWVLIWFLWFTWVYEKGHLARIVHFRTTIRWLMYVCRCKCTRLSYSTSAHTSAHTRVLMMTTVQTGPGQASVILALKESLVKWPPWRFTFIRILHPQILDI